MTIDQPAELNRLVLPSLAERRRRQYAILLPLLSYIAICSLAMSIGADWKQGVTWNWTKALTLAGGVPAVLLVFSEYSLRSTGPSRRMEITQSGVKLRPSPNRHNSQLSWKAVHALEIEPLPGNSTMSRLVIRHGPRNFGWMIGIRSSEELPALRRQIAELQTAGCVSSELIIEFPHAPKRAAVGPAVSLWIGALGLLLFTIGFPFAASSFARFTDDREQEKQRVSLKEDMANLTKKLREAGAPSEESSWWRILARETVAARTLALEFGIQVPLGIFGLGCTLMSFVCFVGQVLWERQAQLSWRVDMQADLQRRTA